MEADGEEKEPLSFIHCIFSCMGSSGLNFQTLRLCPCNQFSKDFITFHESLATGFILVKPVFSILQLKPKNILFEQNCLILYFLRYNKILFDAKKDPCQCVKFNFY